MTKITLKASPIDPAMAISSLITQATIDGTTQSLALEMIEALFSLLEPEAAPYLDTVDAAIALGAQAVETACAITDEPEDSLSRFTLSPEAMAQHLLQLPFTSDCFNTMNKRLALETAEAFGPDHAQGLYRFAVLVTKLA